MLHFALRMQIHSAGSVHQQVGCAFSVPDRGTIDCMDAVLNFWHEDLVEPVTAQIAGEHKNQPEGFSCSSVNLVVGADHGQGSFVQVSKSFAVTSIKVSRQRLFVV